VALEEAGFRQRMQEGGVNVSAPEKATYALDDDLIGERLIDEASGTVFGNMFTMPDSGEVMLQVQSLGSPDQLKLHQIIFQDRSAAFRWLAANSARGMRQTMTNDRLQAISRSQEISMGKTGRDVLDGR
jgi:hypothetical protein